MLDLVLQTITVYIPTMALAMHLATLLQGLRLKRQQIAVSGLVLGLVVTLFRLLPVSFGWHIPAVTVSTVFMIKFLANGRWSMSVLSVLCIQLLGMVGEALVTFPVITLMGIQASDTLSSPILFTFAGWLANVPLLLLWAGLRLYRRHRREAA